ncbi:Beta-galactosidase 5 [Hibiscus syriacus]|uniref:Beta-galactosidase n=1 Tax=Hibiscus syriacus TaxID=106335 RepID=A0A6A3B334_HIBSY|nr:Beta-galactosidase 5 [Hibiscus syriacus]
MINGKRRVLFSGSIHYPRSTPDMWADLIQKAKDGGLDVIETYVFWNVHEPSPGNYNFEGRYDLVRFMKTIQTAGLYAHLRIGPYRFPVWLKFVPGISFRTDNEPFRAMQGFTEKIVGLMKSNNLFESQGGPIILSQIENEYGAQSKLLGAAGSSYVSWAAKMAVETNWGPMGDVGRKMMPQIQWFSEFGGPNHHRPAEDLAFAVARFIQKGGSFVNYTWVVPWRHHFGRTAGGPFITTSYDYEAPIDDMVRKELFAYFHVACSVLVPKNFGRHWIRLIRQPKYGHLKELHKAIKMCERALVSAEPIVTSFGKLQQKKEIVQLSYRTMIPNRPQESYLTTCYNLPPWSISILPDCRNAVFNTAKKLYVAVLTLVQLNFLHGGELPTLIVQSTGHAVHIFINGQLAGSAFGTRENRRITFTGKVNLRAGTNKIALLSVVLDCRLVSHPDSYYLPFGGHFETWNTGILGPVALHGLDQGKRDLSWQKWTYQVGLKGGHESCLAEMVFPLSSGWRIIGSTKTAAIKMAQVAAVMPGHFIRQSVSLVAANQPKMVPCASVLVETDTKSVGSVRGAWRRSIEISLVKRSVSTVCAEIPEYHPNIKNWQIESYGKTEEFHRPKQGLAMLLLYAILEKKCVGKQRCAVTIANSNFGEDPCPNVLKRYQLKQFVVQ